MINDSHLLSIAQLDKFNQGARDIRFKALSRKEKYAWIEKILKRFGYSSLEKKDKSIIKKYLINMTGYSKSQMTRLVAKHKRIGEIKINSGKRFSFPVKYVPEDIALLGKTDLAHERLSGPATKKIFFREYKLFNKEEYARLKDISPSHIYNLRNTRQYTSNTKFFSGTRPVAANIGERRKPEPNGKAGFVRVDTVHQGDKIDVNGSVGQKGVYHVNLVDNVTQWEIVCAVEKISERYLVPVLEQALKQFPFQIIEFHSDNGSEYINCVVAELLNKLKIQQTKSRPRHCNDNALAESKNGGVIRKHMGYAHIEQKHAKKINQFYQNYFNVYLNFHRPCGFATIFTNEKGKEKRKYDRYQTPYEKLKSLRTQSQVLNFLKENISWKELDEIAYAESDNECAEKMMKAKEKLFKYFNN